MAGKLKDRTGEKGINNEGYTMEIVAYRGYGDIDVLVDEKYLHEGRTYTHFKSGMIARIKRTDIANSRIGETAMSREGYSMEIVAYRGSDDIDVLVDNKTVVTHKAYGNFKRGQIGNPYHRSMLGVGYFGEGKYSIGRGKNLENEIYEVWGSMFKRCYRNHVRVRDKSYGGCEVDERFHNFQNFARWYEENYYTVGNERMALDKDILVKNNKIYSPETCIFVPLRINSLFISSRAVRGNLPIGVSKQPGTNTKYRAGISKNGKSPVYLGTFDTPEEAFHAYKTAKEAYIKQVADEYKDKIPKKLYDALYAYTIEITD